MRFDVVTIFPAMFAPVFDQGVVGRAIEKGLIELHAYDELEPMCQAETGPLPPTLGITIPRSGSAVALSQPMRRVGTFGASVVTAHVVNGVQQFVVFQMPPPSCARYATLGFFGSNAIALTRPETSPNVKHGAWQPELACGCGPSGLAADSAAIACAPDECTPNERTSLPLRVR